MGIADELAKLKELRDSGALSEPEFEAAKGLVLGGDRQPAPPDARLGNDAEPKPSPALPSKQTPSGPSTGDALGDGWFTSQEKPGVGASAEPAAPSISEAEAKPVPQKRPTKRAYAGRYWLLGYLGCLALVWIYAFGYARRPSFPSELPDGVGEMPGENKHWVMAGRACVKVQGQATLLMESELRDYYRGETAPAGKNECRRALAELESQDRSTEGSIIFVVSLYSFPAFYLLGVLVYLGFGGLDGRLFTAGVSRLTVGLVRVFLWPFVVLFSRPDGH